MRRENINFTVWLCGINNNMCPFIGFWIETIPYPIDMNCMINQKKVMFRFPSTGKGIQRRGLQPYRKICKLHRFDSLQAGKGIPSIIPQFHPFCQIILFRFPSNGNAKTKSPISRALFQVIIRSFHSLQTGKRSARRELRGAIF